MTLLSSEGPTTVTPAATAADVSVTISNEVPSTKYSAVNDQFGNFYGKPNAIVRPVRRNELDDQMFQSSVLPPATHMNNGNVTFNDDESKKIQRDVVECSFTKELDYKLKHLHGDSKKA